MERVRLALRISKIYCKRIERGGGVGEWGGGGGVGMNIRSFANKAVS